MRLLLVEDYDPLRRSVAQGLREAGFAVDAVADGEDALRRAGATEYDVVVLDLMLPQVDGLTVLRNLRARKHPARVLILTAKDVVSDRVAGLDAGADDYLVKPFAFEELLARVKALVRRRYTEGATAIRVGDLLIDLGARRAERGGNSLDLTAREYALLEFLALRAGQVVSRDEIWEHTYDFAASPGSNVVDVYIGHLRRKLEEHGRPRLIHTRRGMGYVLEEQP